MKKKEFKATLENLLTGKGVKEFKHGIKTIRIVFNNSTDYTDFKEFIMSNYYSVSEGLVVSGSYYDDRQTIILDYK
ncbi:hypothetical protein [Ligilactobacillus salivarius]|uniref:hypothetical protein n=1 Tax=Ligilactobacillus salivarius TaxID=1624 RepID=UPI0013712F80|nr:hypothetical protein [Ligilactobacillus salivarius]MYV10563.1 hypothetical protein [Ligilactobacillus salivarius]